MACAGKPRFGTAEMTPSLIGELDAALLTAVPMLQDRRAVSVLGADVVISAWTLRDEQDYTRFLRLAAKVHLLALGKPVAHEERPGSMSRIETRAMELFRRGGVKVWWTVDPPVRGTETTPGKGGEYVLRWEE